MTWSAPPTVVSNTFITVAWGNTIRDLLLETVPAKASAAGQVPYASGVNAVSMLNAVANGYLRMNSGGTAPAWQQGVIFAQEPVFAGAGGVAMTTVATDIVTQSFTTSGGPVLAIGFGRAIGGGGSAAIALNGSFDIERDSTVLDAAYAHDYNPHSPFAFILNAGMINLSTPAAGTYTYRVKGSYSLLSGTVTTPSMSAVLFLAELKL